MHARFLKNLPADTVYDILPSPVGDLYAFANDEALFGLLWHSDIEGHDWDIFLKGITRSSNALICQTQRELKEYFDGSRQRFEVPIQLHGTDFQQKSWRALRTIPYGKTITYGDQADKVGHRKKARAVGLANSLNPIGIIVPCHRVIGKNGKLTGFAGGLDMKKFLLDFESSYA